MPFNKKIIFFAVIAILITSLPSLALADVYGDVNENLSYFSKIFGPAKDPKIIVINILKVVLSLLGVIFVTLIIYAGFLWMTAAGNSERLQKAKDVLTSSAIGLAIVMAAWGITRFVICALINATTGTWAC